MKKAKPAISLPDERLTREQVISRVEALVQPYLAALGAELVELEYAMPKRGRGVVRLFVDRPGGITLEDLTRISRVVGELLDVHDFIVGAYNLEVSSPGLTRALKTPRDYERYVGRLVRITTRGPWDGRQVHCGVLQGLQADQVRLQVGDRLAMIPFSEIARARLDIETKKHGKEG